MAEALLPGLPALEELGSLNIQQQSQTRHGVKEGGTGPGAKNPGLCWGRPLGSKAPQSAGKLTSCVSGKVLARGRSGPPFFHQMQHELTLADTRCSLPVSSRKHATCTNDQPDGRSTRISIDWWKYGHRKLRFFQSKSIK